MTATIAPAIAVPVGALAGPRERSTARRTPIVIAGGVGTVASAAAVRDVRGAALRRIRDWSPDRTAGQTPNSNTTTAIAIPPRSSVLVSNAKPVVGSAMRASPTGANGDARNATTIAITEPVTAMTAVRRSPTVVIPPGGRPNTRIVRY